MIIIYIIFLIFGLMYVILQYTEYLNLLLFGKVKFTISHYRDLKVKILNSFIRRIAMPPISFSILPEHTIEIIVYKKPKIDTKQLSFLEIYSNKTAYVYKDGEIIRKILFCNKELKRIFGKIPNKIFFNTI